MSVNYTVITKLQPSIAINRVLRNTYLLLGCTLIFSAITATLALASHSYPGTLTTIIGMFGFLFLTQALRNSKWGLLAVFLFTGFMGYTLAPILGFYLHTFVNGGSLIMTSLMGTGIIFFVFCLKYLIRQVYALRTLKSGNPYYVKTIYLCKSG